MITVSYTDPRNGEKRDVRYQNCALKDVMTDLANLSFLENIKEIRFTKS